MNLNSLERDAFHVLCHKLAGADKLTDDELTAIEMFVRCMNWSDRVSTEAFKFADDLLYAAQKDKESGHS